MCKLCTNMAMNLQATKEQIQMSTTGRIKRRYIVIQGTVYLGLLCEAVDFKH